MILTAHRLASAIGGLTDDPHLTTHPGCAEYRPVRPGSRLDRYSRGRSCTPCMVTRAWGRDDAMTEACIPLDPAKRQRSREVLAEVVRQLDADG